MDRLDTLAAAWRPAQVAPQATGAHGLTRARLQDILAPLVAGYQGVEMDTPAAWRAYWHAVDDVSEPVLMLAVSRLLKSGGKFFPRPSELRTACAEARTAMLGQHPYRACDECHGTGWREKMHADGYRAERCACWTAHRQRLAALGVGSAVPVSRQLTEGEDA